MGKLSTADQHSLDTFNGWREWGERFGFILHGTNDEWSAAFYLPGGEPFNVPKEARELIDTRYDRLTLNFADVVRVKRSTNDRLRLAIKGLQEVMKASNDPFETARTTLAQVTSAVGNAQEP